MPYQTNYHKTDIKDTLDLYTPFGMWCEYTVRVCRCHVHVCVHHPVWDVCICLCMCVCPDICTRAFWVLVPSIAHLHV